MNSSYVFISILPLFSLIILGLILKKSYFDSEIFWRYTEKLAFYVLFPALLINSLAKADFYEVKMTKMIICLILLVTLVTTGMIILKKLFHINNKSFTSYFQGAIRYNTYVFIGLTELLYGSKATVIVYVVSAYMVVYTNLLSVIIMDKYLSAHNISFVKLFMKIITNPLIVACIIGVIINFTGLYYGVVIDKFLSYVGMGALPLSMMCVGAGLHLIFDIKKNVMLILVSFIKLIVTPVLLFFLFKLFGVTGVVRSVGILFGSVPVAASSYIMAREMGGDHEIMASIVSVQTIVSLLTISIIVPLLT